MSITMRTDRTPNPNAMKFTANSSLFTDRLIAKKGDSVDHPLAAALLEIEGVDNIFGYDDFVTVNKTFDASWDELLPKIEAVFQTN
ncbi:NifU N-terminal domain-containing protein [Pullulanibacillus sp. KACC 23026]|uniref:NifU N-terminal domain-containing protein n=1 Tax=Pullulanibacillus sp. KACC 23026 TaxID=3028315 RepID=UPI0023AFAE52|nr:NifU N-terminal domain-containing protein [Pullulanibacillus sp. KACC 23026]WEG11945.1 NifU N-terminal domain-containing protein [Pullulanibacillus sp. KACC 23026]